MCLCLLLSAPFNLSPRHLSGSPVSSYCLDLSLLPDHLSINLLWEPLLPPGFNTICPVSVALKYLGLSSCFPPFPCSFISPGLRGLFRSISLQVFLLSLHAPASPAAPPLSYLPCTPFPCMVLSEGLSGLSLSLHSSYLFLIASLYDFFLASNLFMFPLVPLWSAL